MSHSVPIAETTSVAIEIGGLPLVLFSGDAGFHTMVQERYPGFARAGDRSESGMPPLYFDVEILRDGELTGDEDVRVWKESEIWNVRRGDFHAQFNLASRKGCIRQELNPYALNSIMRIVHTVYLAYNDGFLLHAASAVRNRSAFVFSGISGSGKTTISRCAPGDVTLLTDEISYIRAQENEYRAWGTPFSGELANPGENISAPVRQLFFLEKGPENQIRNLPKVEAIRLLLRNVLFFCEDEDLVHRVFDSTCDFVERVPVHGLTFVPDARVWRLIR